MMTDEYEYYTLELDYVDPDKSMYEYFKAKPENHEGFITTTAPKEAMHWRKAETALEFLESLPNDIQSEFHVQAMVTNDHRLEFEDQ